MSAGRLLRGDALVPVPWRNGQGITREIAVMPPGAGPDDFLWRVSLAEVVGPAPFSRFPGVDRTIVLLDGEGFCMTLDGARVHELTTPCAPFAFPGESAVSVALASGATRDFNLMLRRGRVSGGIEMWRGPGRCACPADLALVYAVQGPIVTPAGTLAGGDSWLSGAPPTDDVTLAAGALALIVRVCAAG